MTAATANAVLNFRATAPGVGFNLWEGAAKTEIRTYRAGFTYANGDWKAPTISPMMALALVREADCRGSEIHFWQCCACGDKATAKALGPKISHGMCPLHAAEFRAAALEFALTEAKKNA